MNAADQGLEADVTSGKRELRQHMRARRLTVPADDAERAAAAACARALPLPIWNGVRTVALYRAIRGELPTAALEAALVARGIRVVLPRVDAPVPGGLLSFHVANAPLTSGPMGLAEPDASTPNVPLAEIDVFILPGLAFDARGARLGWGRGHFDATLTATPAALRLAWAFDFQVVAEVPETPSDVRVDIIISDAEVRLTGARPLPRRSS